VFAELACREPDVLILVSELDHRRGSKGNYWKAGVEVLSYGILPSA
jgi:hypothetical protein